MKNVLILHGTLGNGCGNWFPWLKKELQKAGFNVWLPDLPKSDIPNLRRYNDFIFKNWKFDTESIIIGHSSGATAILAILQELPEKTVVNKVCLVSGFLHSDWEPNKELFLIPFDWEKIKKHAREFVLFQSDDDPYVSLSEGKELKEKTGGELIMIPNQGHFNLEKGPQFKKFPQLLEKILE